jgi:hypothetical protein
MLTVTFAETHYAECRYAECPYAECYYAECRYAECCYAECHYAECHYAECHYAERRGTVYASDTCIYITWFKQMPIQRLTLILNISIKILFTILYWLETTLYPLSQHILSQLY